jgi:hypothetical protein
MLPIPDSNVRRNLGASDFCGLYAGVSLFVFIESRDATIKSDANAGECAN